MSRKLSPNRDPNEILKRYWGYNDFRPQQKEIILSILEGKDTLALLPTGGGKSICFQIPALIIGKLCLVISPLIALMQDQVETLQSKGIKALALFSGQTKGEQSAILEQAVKNQLNFLYISPERLASHEFKGWLQNMELGLVAIDEAHCISQWGYDFRPEYLKISEIREVFPGVPMLALTASATQEVVKDIIKSLKFRNGENIFRRSFIRENLIYLIRRTENKKLKILEICNNVKGAGIIYSRNRRGTEQLSLYLQRNNISCNYYHAGLSSEERNLRQTEWINNTTRIMVCTNAFGMGIDKPDVRFVIHYEPPDCIESYYQEAGRAGRDGQKAFCILCYFDTDLDNEKHKIDEQYPDDKTLNKIYHYLCNYLKIMVGSGEGTSHDFILSNFCSEYNLPIRSTHFAISMLQKSGYLNLNENGIINSTIKILVSPSELYKLQVENEEYNKLILALLRTRGGYFDFYTQVDEMKIALLLNQPQNKIIEMLNFLHNKEYIDYQSKTTIPQIVLTTPRYDKISPNRKLINSLQDKAIKRLEGMNSYIHNKSLCRNNFIAKYFGEKTQYKCKKCDVCIDSDSGNLSAKQFEFYRTFIMERLINEKQDIHTLSSGLKGSSLAEFLIAINWMLNNHWVVKDKTGLLEWKKGKK
ncbi:MAG: RecQ family ATP-dependent DNA helicase [Bacteroidetes bacterium]|nr:RecQ family ATP-dependent DNA helicase [Bacteroidota bacterium]